MLPWFKVEHTYIIHYIISFNFGLSYAGFCGIRNMPRNTIGCSHEWRYHVFDEKTNLKYIVRRNGHREQHRDGSQFNLKVHWERVHCSSRRPFLRMDDDSDRVRAEAIVAYGAAMLGREPWLTVVNSSRRFRALFGVSLVISCREMARQRRPKEAKPALSDHVHQDKSLGARPRHSCRGEWKTYRRWQWTFLKLIALLKMVSFLSMFQFSPF